MTNYERIKNMSIEELALTIMCPNEPCMADIECDKSDKQNCCQCCLNWLGADEAATPKKENSLETLVFTIASHGKRIAELEKIISQPQPIAIKTVKIEYTDLQEHIRRLYDYVHTISEYMDKAFIPALDALIQQALSETQCVEEVSLVHLSEPP